MTKNIEILFRTETTRNGKFRLVAMQRRKLSNRKTYQAREFDTREEAISHGKESLRLKQNRNLSNFFEYRFSVPTCCPECGASDDFRVWESTLSTGGFDAQGVFRVGGFKDSQIDSVTCRGCDYEFSIEEIAEMDINFN